MKMNKYFKARNINPIYIGIPLKFKVRTTKIYKYCLSFTRNVRL